MTALAAVGLVGCSASGDSACDIPSDVSGVSDLVSVSGSTSRQPQVEVRTPFHVDGTKAFTAVEGDGEKISEEGQAAALEISLFSGADGSPLVATGYDEESLQAFPLSQWAQTLPTLPGALQCAAAGSRVVVALSPDDIAPQAVAGLGLAQGDSAVAVVDVRKVFLPKADGADQYNESHGLPTVVRAPDGRPGIIVPEAEAPTEKSVQVLKRGEGEEVPSGASVVLQLASVAWDDPRTTIKTTWDTGAAVAPLDRLEPNLAEAVTGATVGSQLLVVVPAEDAARGAKTMVYVVDVLGID